jgi:hypothetical protein
MTTQLPQLSGFISSFGTEYARDLIKMYECGTLIAHLRARFSTPIPANIHPWHIINPDDTTMNIINPDDTTMNISPRFKNGIDTYNIESDAMDID